MSEYYQFIKEIKGMKGAVIGRWVFFFFLNFFLKCKKWKKWKGQAAICCSPRSGTGSKLAKLTVGLWGLLMSTCGSELGSWVCHMKIYIYICKTQKIEEESCWGHVVVRNPKQWKPSRSPYLGESVQTLQMLIFSSLITPDSVI